MTNFADQYLEPDFSLTPALLAVWTVAAETEAKLGYLVDDFKALTWAAAIPRRLGGAAKGDALALDKKRLKAGAHLLRGLIDGWAVHRPGWDFGSLDLDAVPLELRQRGAQLDWSAWVELGIDRATWDRSRVVTIGLQAGERRWANAAANLLTREILELGRLAAKYV